MKLPDWITSDLSRFASGEWHWEQWPHWVAVHGRQLSVELNSNWLDRIKNDPHVEVPALLGLAGIEVPPHSSPKIIEHPIDNDPEYADIIAVADDAAANSVTLPDSEMGYCHLFWLEKKRFLKERYGIDWQSPADLNPDIIFD